ncbi:hypothetical protein M407DRAFT_142593 [Tulasnella calospora MUT 4182]|uniref:Uncharacterized protein n=1 Tax=Tulasnella calospora MUT 4182 TaxID=1051891 RepID=A0A0C3LES2_9AGAM|nr:hypothetical protein M407DRAFT_142593 [Tulasnella calospora MUT 4182]
MPAFLSPGVSYVFSSIAPKLVAPPALILILNQLHNNQNLIPLSIPTSLTIPPIPQWLLTPSALIASSVAGSLVIVFGKALWQSLQQRYEMWRLNAVPIPVVKSKWPGGLDVLAKLLGSLENEYAAQYIEDLTVEYGYLYCLSILGEDYIVTFNPDDIKRILATDFQTWEKGEAWHGPMNSVLGSGVFNSDGEMWKFHRNMTRPFFSRERIADFEIFRRHSDHAVHLIKQRCSTGEAIDLQDIAGRLTMDSATEFLLGRSVDSMSSPLPQPGRPAEERKDTESAFVSAFTAALGVCTFRVSVRDTWPLWELKGDASRPHMKVVYEYLNPIVDEAIKKKRSTPGEDDENTLLGHLVAATNDRDIIRDEILNILLAGRDTTAHAITAIFYFLATEKRSIFDRLRQEVLDVVGEVNPLPSFEQVRDMRYLRAVINETLRLMPSVPANMRQATKSSVWVAADGTRYYIPKGITASWSTIGLHRRSDLWGPDALIFDPDRWLDERHKKYYLANPFIFLPFHGGPRICLGQQVRALRSIPVFPVPPPPRALH